MRCEEFQSVVETLGRGDLMAEEVRRDALGHVEICPACGKELKESRALSAALRRVARALEPEEAPPEIEARLLSAFRQRQAARVSYWQRHRAWMSAAASVLVLGFALTRVSPRPAAGGGHSAEVAVGESFEETEEIASDFFPLQGDLDLPDAEGRGVVRVLVPRTTLLAFGLPMNHERAFEPLQAEVLIGEDGAPKAIRFLNERP